MAQQQKKNKGEESIQAEEKTTMTIKQCAWQGGWPEGTSS